MNICNSAASNQLNNQEMAISFALAISTSIGASVGLRKLLTRIKLPGLLGSVLIKCTPYFGVVSASTVNLFFSRNKDLTEGIQVLHPKTNEPIKEVKSVKAGQYAFLDALFVRWFIPILSK